MPSRYWKYRNRPDSGVTLKVRTREAAVRAFKEGQVPFCGERMRGIWWIEGEDGFFFEALGGREAFEPVKRRIVELTPADPEIVAEKILVLAQEKQCWDERDSEVPF